MNPTIEDLELLYSLPAILEEIERRRDELLKKCGARITDPELLAEFQTIDEALAGLRQSIANIQALLPAPTN